MSEGPDFSSINLVTYPTMMNDAVTNKKEEA